MNSVLIRCDICGCDVKVDYFNFKSHTKTVVYTKMKDFSIGFYCSDCIKKRDIKVDLQNTKDWFYYE